MIASGTSLIVKRVPVKQQRRKFDNSTGANAMSGNNSALHHRPNMSMEAGNALPLLAGGGESDRIDALLAQGAGWQPGQAVPARPRFLQTANQKLPPPTYVCHRCQQTGHWINMCPTNGDTNFDFKRIKKVRQEKERQGEGHKASVALMQFVFIFRQLASLELFWKLWTKVK